MHLHEGGLDTTNESDKIDWVGEVSILDQIKFKTLHEREVIICGFLGNQPIKQPIFIQFSTLLAITIIMNSFGEKIYFNDYGSVFIFKEIAIILEFLKFQNFLFNIIFLRYFCEMTHFN